MPTWILILFVYAGPMADTDSVALASTPGFLNQAACERAGQKALQRFPTGVKDAKFVCVADR